jgi:hypothetical protein
VGESGQKKPYAKYAFHNLYNYTLLGAVGVVAAVTGTWIPLAVGAGLEALWMLNAPGSKGLQRLWFDKVHGEKEEKARAAKREAAMASLDPDDARRVASLEMKQQEILRLASENEQFAGDLLERELSKLARLTDAFVDLALGCRKFEVYLMNVDYDELESSLRRYRQTSEKAEDPILRTTAKKNLEVLMRRQEKLQDLKRFTISARAQLDLIENTFKLLGDQILTMRSPTEIGSQLDELIDGVEAVRSTVAEREQLLAQTA